MANKKLPQIQTSTSVSSVLERSKNLMTVTQKVLQKAKTAKELKVAEDDSWINRLHVWAQEFECLGNYMLQNTCKTGGDDDGVFNADGYELGLVFRFGYWNDKALLATYKLGGCPR